jgi:hypothetical protein
LDKEFKNGNYWKLPPDPDFVLKRSIQQPGNENLKNGICPDPYFEPKVFFWFPLMFFPEFVVRCVETNCNGEMKSAGQATFPRRCYGLQENYFIFTQRFLYFKQKGYMQ